jgi:hypothetical protein
MACSGRTKPSSSEVMDAARRLGSPVDVRKLMQELMK